MHTYIHTYTYTQAGLGSKYIVLRPYVLDGYRNQNSMILARRDKFLEGSRADLTEHVSCLFVSYMCVYVLVCVYV